MLYFSNLLHRLKRRTIDTLKTVYNPEALALMAVSEGIKLLRN